jgi:hypothetical protein
MRSEWKQVEKVALQLLSEALLERGIPPIYCPDITDAPDALFLIGGRGIAIECRYIAHSELLKHIGMRSLVPDIAYEVVIPREPHLWVRDAIIAKNLNIDKYVDNTGAKEAWLLLHSSMTHAMLTGEEGDELFRTLLALGTHLTPHKFTRIWFAEAGPNPLPAIEIFGPDIPKPSFDWDKYVEGFLPGYPHDTKWFSTVVVKENEDGGKFVSVNLNDERAKPIGLQPLDAKYKLDYSYLSDPLRNSNRTGLSYSFYDDPRPKY